MSRGGSDRCSQVGDDVEIADRGRNTERAFIGKRAGVLRRKRRAACEDERVRREVDHQQAIAPLDEHFQLFSLMIGGALVDDDFYATIAPGAPPHHAIKCVNSRTGEHMRYRCVRAHEPALLWQDGEPAARPCTACGQWVPRISEKAHLKVQDTNGFDVLFAIAGVYVRAPEVALGWKGNFLARAIKD